MGHFPFSLSPSPSVAALSHLKYIGIRLLRLASTLSVRGTFPFEARIAFSFLPKDFNDIRGDGHFLNLSIMPKLTIQLLKEASRFTTDEHFREEEQLYLHVHVINQITVNISKCTPHGLDFDLSIGLTTWSPLVNNICRLVRIRPSCHCLTGIQAQTSINHPTVQSHMITHKAVKVF